MRRLSVWLLRVGLLAALAALAVSVAALMLGDWLLLMRLEAALTPEMQAELQGTGPLSVELAARLDGYYQTWPARLVTPAAVMLGLIAGAAVALIPARRLVATFGDLADTARRIGSGDLSARAAPPTIRIDEIERFRRDFNTMAAFVERADGERRDSSAAIAHELRTPLTVLSGRLQGMLDGVFPTDARSLAALLAQAQLLARIVDDLRLLTLADSGRLEMQLAPVDLAAPARDVKVAMAPLLQVDGLAVTAALSPARVDGDADRLRQAVQALMTNAARYGGAEVRVETGQDDKTAWVSVMDRGQGLSAADAARAFDRFWRADPSRGRAGGGSGLGLSVVRAIAQAHGGQVTYADRPGGGAIFTLRLPRDHAHLAKASDADPAAT
ncbi:ATP-binding protein [Paracoccus sp. p4-l81]|uniref:ATP-binding protein n=1 Tax=unclassified Paracoccus (in: a-proteobacteria) TaxID=2688777 RepID=UPI0035BA8312